MRAILFAALSTAVLAACGGGAGSSTGPMQNSAPVVTSGTITAFGSVYVNGVRYDVSAATLKKNGRTVAQSDLAVGEVALVSGQQDLQSQQGTATHVDVEDNVVGPISAIAASQLTVLGQTINVTATTSFGKGIMPADLTGLKVGDSVEVSGLVGSGGVIAATRIGRAGANEGLQVLGTVAGTVSSAHTFTINGLTVDFSSAALTGFTNGQPADGNLVVVSGGTFDAAMMTLKAAAVTLAGTDPREAAAGGRVEQEGLITRFVSATDFDVAGSKVTTTGATVYKGGSAADLVLNARVEVRGTVDAGGVLVADAIEIPHVSALEVEAALVTAPTANALVLLGVSIAVDSNTRFEDKSAAELQLFTLKDVAVGDTLLVRGYESPLGSGNLLATRVERLPPSTAVIVRGAFSAPATPLFKILGITVDTTGATFGLDEGNQTLTSAQFFTQAMGQIVAARGTATGNTVTATTVQIDSHEDR